MIPTLQTNRNAAFSPLALNPSLWYDASDVTTLFQDTAGTVPVTTQFDPVARINDKSGNGNNELQATANIRPLWDQTRLNCFWATNTTGRQACLLNTSTTAITRDAMSGGIIFDPMTTCTDAPLIALGNSEFAFSLGSNNINLRTFDGAIFTNTSLVFWGRKNVLTWRNNGSNLLLNINGTTQSLTAISAASMTRAYMAQYAGGAQKSVRIYEEIVCSSDIGATNQAALQAYLVSKAGYVPDATKTVMVVGDSLSAGVGSEHGIRPSDYITNRPNSTWYVYGVDGGFMLAPLPTAATALTLKGSSEGIYHLYLGVNDINSGAATGLQTAARAKTYSEAIRAGGGKCIGYTLQQLPNNDAERLICNTQMGVDSASYDILVDLAASFPNCADATKFTSDQIHMMDAGYVIFGGLMQTAQASL